MSGTTQVAGSMSRAAPPTLTPSIRLRRTPFWDAVERSGVKSVSIYNHMLLPSMFESVEEDYHHLKTCVQLWDVSCQRQVELRGPDASRLVQMMTPRNISDMSDGQCIYAPVVDVDGGILNDPVILRHGPDHFWLSISDSDLLFWVLGLATGAELEVAVSEPEVSPLAIQGPRAEDLAAAVFGDRIRKLRFFEIGYYLLCGHRLAVARSGYSKQGGFEVYVTGQHDAIRVWETFMEAGQAYDVRPGCPNVAERIEGGFLSYGSDMTRQDNPFECGLERYCRPQEAPTCVGHEALVRIERNGIRRRIRPIEIDGLPVPPCDRRWPVACGEQPAGYITSAAWSPGLNTNVAIGMIEEPFWDAGMELTAILPGGARSAILHPHPFSTTLEQKETG